MPTNLPTKLYQARTVRVMNLNCVLVDLSLNFGVTISKNIVVEGIDGHAVPQARRHDAMHCLVLIVGGRDLLLHTDDSTLDGYLKSRVYLDGTAPSYPDGTVAVPYGLDEPRIEVGLLWSWAQRNNFDPRALSPYVHQIPRAK